MQTKYPRELVDKWRVMLLKGDIDKEGIRERWGVSKDELNKILSGNRERYREKRRKKPASA